MYNYILHHDTTKLLSVYTIPCDGPVWGRQHVAVAVDLTGGAQLLKVYCYVLEKERGRISLPYVVASLRHGTFLASPFLKSISRLERALKATTEAHTFQQENGSFVTKSKR